MSHEQPVEPEQQQQLWLTAVVLGAVGAAVWYTFLRPRPPSGREAGGGNQALDTESLRAIRLAKLAERAQAAPPPAEGGEALAPAPAPASASSPAPAAPEVPARAADVGVAPKPLSLIHI